MVTRIFIDCTDTYLTGMNTGIQRVVRAFAANADTALLGSEFQAAKVVFEDGLFREISDFNRISPRQRRQRIRQKSNAAFLSVVRWLAKRTDGLPYFQRFLLAHKDDFGLANIITLPVRLLRNLLPESEPISALQTGMFHEGDVLFLPDGTWMHDNCQAIEEIRRLGVTVAVFIHDIIPLTHPDTCHPSLSVRFGRWLAFILPHTDILVFNSNFSKTCLENYLLDHPIFCPANQRRYVVHLGFDIPREDHRGGEESEFNNIFESIGNTYLCVGTLDPRKNHDVLLDAFDILWKQGSSSKLLLIGKDSYLCHELTERIRNHRYINDKLYWLTQADDFDLIQAYKKSHALLFPSLVEGFGLPLVEALSYSLPIICSDIPVFHEIAGDNACYFPPKHVLALLQCIQMTENEISIDRHSGLFLWPTWLQATCQLMDVLSKQNKII